MLILRMSVTCSESGYLNRSCFIRSFYIFCELVSESFTTSHHLSLIIGKTTDAVTLFSPESMSVRLERGERALLIDWSTAISCHVGTRWHAFLSALRTIRMASSCSNILDTIFAIDPHLVGTSETNECCQRSRFSLAFVNSCFSFQLIKNELTIFLDTPRA